MKKRQNLKIDIDQTKEQDAANDLIMRFGMYARDAAILVKDNIPMYTGNLNPNWTFWNNVAGICDKQLHGDY